MVEYSHYLPKIQTGDLLAWSVRKWETMADITSQVIRLAIRSEYCHVGIALVISSRVFVVEAVPPFVRIYPLEKLLPFYHLAIPHEGYYYNEHYKLDFNQDDITKNRLSAEDYLLSLIGDKYSTMQAIMSAFTKPKEDKLWQCAELVNNFYKEMGLDIGDIYIPSDLVEAMQTIISIDNTEVSTTLITPENYTIK